MAVPAAKFAWPILMKLYLNEPGSRTKQGLAVALSNVTDDDVIDHLIAAAKDASNGESRILLLEAIFRSHLPRAQEALTELKSDPVLRKEIVARLGRE